MQDAGGKAGTGHVTKDGFRKVLTQAFNTLPWESGALELLNAKYAEPETGLVPYYDFMYSLFQGTPTCWHTTDTNTGAIFRNDAVR